MQGIKYSWDNSMLFCHLLMINYFLKNALIPPLDISFPVGETCSLVYFSRSSELYWTHLPCLKRDKVLAARGRVELGRVEAAPMCGAGGKAPRAASRRALPFPSAGGDRLRLNSGETPQRPVLEGATKPLRTALPRQQVPQRNDYLKINRFQLFI